MDLSAIGSVVGVIGGGCGVVAFVLQLKDRRDKASRAHLAPEMRNLLLALLPPLEEVARIPQTRGWIAENLTPLEDQYATLFPHIRDAEKDPNIGLEWQAIEINIAQIFTYADTDQLSTVQTRIRG